MSRFHVGTYAKDGGRGLVPVTLAPDGLMTPGQPYAAAKNASFAAYSQRHGLHYMVDEQKVGALGVYRRSGDAWDRLARVDTGGAAPCYVALNADETRLAVANYDSGSAALFALDSDGLPQPQALFQNEGGGLDPERQEGPHVHCARFTPDGALYAVDLGTDEILRFDEELIGTRQVYRAPPGSGPRHLLFVPGRPLAILLSELASTLTLLEVSRDGMLRPLQIVSTLPAGFKGDSLGGHLALNAAGTRVYVSNRGHDSLALFALEERARELLQHVTSTGAHPRNFVLLEIAGKLVVAHEKDGRVASFTIASDGQLELLGKGAVVPGACCIIA